MRTCICLVFSVVLFSCASQPEEAAAPAPPGPKVLQTTPQERLMVVLDEDGNGVLNDAELKRFAPNLPLRDTDTNGDGVVDTKELRLILDTKSPLREKHRGRGRFARPGDPDYQAPLLGSDKP